MGLTVALETEDGQQLATVQDPTGILNRLLPAVGDPQYRCLGWIDLYGNTVFNRMQASQFLAEWQRLRRDEHTPEVLRLLEGIRTLAERVRDEVHLYLKFYGD